MQKILILILIAFVLPLSKAHSQTEDVVWLKEGVNLNEFKFHPTQDIFTSFNEYWKGLKIFDKMTGDSIGMFPIKDSIYKLKYFYSQDGKYLLTSSIQGYVRVWNFDTREIIFSTDLSTYMPEDVAKHINVRQLDLSNNQKYLAISLGGAGFIIFDFEKQKAIKKEYWEYQDPKWGTSYLFVNSIDISPDNNLVVMNREDGIYHSENVLLYDIKKNKTEYFDLGTNAIFSPTDNVMYYFKNVYDDQTGEVKNIGRYYVNFDISDEPIKSPANMSDCVFSFDGKFIVVRSKMYYENVFYRPYIFKTDDLYHVAYKRPYNDVFTI